MAIRGKHFLLGVHQFTYTFFFFPKQQVLIIVINVYIRTSSFSSSVSLKVCERTELLLKLQKGFLYVFLRIPLILIVLYFL